jgi:glycine betaine/proline transport system permease protein
MNIPQIPVGDAFEAIITWLTDYVGFLFDAIGATVTAILSTLEFVLLVPHPMLMIAILTGIAFFFAGRGVAIFTALGMLLIANMGYWTATMETLTLVLGSVLIALLIGVPVGIWSAKSDNVERIIRPVLDFMQTLPAFVYLIPAVLLFRLGPVPAVIATLIFSLPPAVRLTNLGIRQVPDEIREAALSFGSSPRQLLFKAELPVALPTIMAGVNQTIMLALSMVVIACMIGAGGLGNEVLKGITQLQIDIGFEAGISIVILAIFLDRVTQSLTQPKKKSN